MLPEGEGTPMATSAEMLSDGLLVIIDGFRAFFGGLTPEILLFAGVIFVALAIAGAVWQRRLEKLPAREKDEHAEHLDIGA